MTNKNTMNNRQPITIADKTYQIGFSFRAFKLFEEMTGHKLSAEASTWDEIQYTYCCLKAINSEFALTLDQFIDELDANPQLLIDLQFGVQQDNEPEQEAAESTKKKTSIKVFFLLWMLSILLLAAPVLIPVTFGLILIFRSLKGLYRVIAKVGKKRARLFNR